MKYDVFISYSSKDQKIAEGICGYLESHKLRCFVAYRDIPKGKVWAAEIVKGLDESQIMVIVFSENFNCSEQVDREIELAAEDKKPILTFRITDNQFKGAKKYYLKNLNWIDAFPSPEASFGALYSDVCKLLGKQVSDKDVLHASGENNAKEEVITKSQQTAEDLYQMGENYYYGRNGYSKDYAEAVKWYRKAAEQGNASGQNNLGGMYHFGRGVTQDYTEAVKWYRKAAEQGLARAQYNLGWMYHSGQGVSKDYTEAVKWYRKAAEQGLAEGQNNLGWVYYYGQGVDENKEQAKKYFQQAAKQGYQDAKTFLEEHY